MGDEFRLHYLPQLAECANMLRKQTHQEIACQQVLVEDSSVFSVQWMVLLPAIADRLTPVILLQRYVSYLRRCTLSIIRPLNLETGLEFRLLGSTWSLISFLPLQVDAYSATLRICGGLLVQPRQCDRGELRFAVEHVDEGVRVSLQLSEFCPLILGSQSPTIIRFWLYRLTQAAIHRLVTVRFLSLLYWELAGRGAKIKTVVVAVRDGRSV